MSRRLGIFIAMAAVACLGTAACAASQGVGGPATPRVAAIVTSRPATSTAAAQAASGTPQVFASSSTAAKSGNPTKTGTSGGHSKPTGQAARPKPTTKAGSSNGGDAVEVVKPSVRDHDAEGNESPTRDEPSGGSIEGD